MVLELDRVVRDVPGKAIPLVVLLMASLSRARHGRLPVTCVPEAAFEETTSSLASD